MEVKQLLHLKEVLQILGVSRSTLLRWIELNGFPRPVQIEGTKRARRWRSREVQEWIDGIKEASSR